MYSCLAPKEDLLAELGPVNDLDLLSFARQTAAGMVQQVFPSMCMDVPLHEP